MLSDDCVPCRLILGMMLTASFLSMWLSNTATTAMMLPIANAILESLFGDLETLKRNCRSGEDAENEVINGTGMTFHRFELQAHGAHTVTSLVRY